MTPEQLEEIEKLHAAATPGEWTGDRHDGTVKYRVHSESCDCDREESWNCPHLVLEVDHKNGTSGFHGKYSEENEKLVLALHNAFPAMAKALREAWQERDVLQAVLNDWQRFGMEREKERNEARTEVERLRGIVEVNDRRLAAVWDEARVEVERLRRLLGEIP